LTIGRLSSARLPASHPQRGADAADQTYGFRLIGEGLSGAMQWSGLDRFREGEKTEECRR